VVDLSLEEVRAVPLAEVATTLDLEAVPSVLVIVSLRPPLSGDIILYFDLENARELAKQLAGSTSSSRQGFNDLEQSALLETGNILGCAYVNALSRMINHELIPIAPWLVFDLAESVIEQALAQQAERSDSVIVSRTRFRRDEGDLSWFVLFLPGPSLQQAMKHSLRASSPHLG
jgi:chemotaxis protein CheC